MARGMSHLQYNDFFSRAKSIQHHGTARFFVWAQNEIKEFPYAEIPPFALLHASTSPVMRFATKSSRI